MKAMFWALLTGALRSVRSSWRSFLVEEFIGLLLRIWGAFRSILYGNSFVVPVA